MFPELWKLKRKINIDACNLDSDSFCSFFNNFIQFAKKKFTYGYFFYHKQAYKSSHFTHSLKSRPCGKGRWCSKTGLSAWINCSVLSFLSPWDSISSQESRWQKENSKSYIYLSTIKSNNDNFSWTSLSITLNWCYCSFEFYCLYCCVEVYI